MEKITQTWLVINENSVNFKIVILCSVGLVFVICKAILYACLALSLLQKIYLKLLNSVIYSEQSFFEKNPGGRILNRFLEDIASVDILLPLTSIQLINSFTVFLACSITNLVLIIITNVNNWIWSK